MRPQLVIGSGFVAKYPDGGGNYWVPLQYLRGFRDLGVDAFWLEVLEGSGDALVDARFIDTFLDRAHRLGVADWTAVAFYPRGTNVPDERQVIGGDPIDLDARMRDAVLLNMAGSLGGPQLEPFAKTILYDLDPGLFQLWAMEWGESMGIGTHDIYLTIGQRLAAPDSPIPLGGVEWHTTWPAVHLPSWPAAATDGRCYTTVTQWWSAESASLHGEVYECSKRNSFIRFVDVPQRTPVCLELAANIHPSETDEATLFSQHGWRLVQPEVVVRSPEQYREYVAGSRGEFGCAKPAYVKARVGWLSDRSVCYLASGRPCVLQDTGASESLPQSVALQFFSTSEEAGERLAAVERDYRRASFDARRLAESHFSTDVLLPRILALAGL